MTTKEINELDKSAYSIFARLHPIEAYHFDNNRFCNFMRDEGYNITDEEVKQLILESE